MARQRQAAWIVIELTGAVIGGVVGVWLFGWISRQGFYAIVLPGAMVGLGSLLMARGNSMIRGLLCGVIALAATLYAEWSVFPFVKDKSFVYFITHLSDLRPITLILMAIGILLAVYLGKGSAFPAQRVKL